MTPGTLHRSRFATRSTHSRPLASSWRMGMNRSLPEDPMRSFCRLVQSGRSGLEWTIQELVGVSWGSHGGGQAGRWKNPHLQGLA